MNKRGDIDLKDILTILAVYILLIGIVSSSANITINQNSTIIKQNNTQESSSEIQENITILNQTQEPQLNESQEPQAENKTIISNSSGQNNQTENISVSAQGLNEGTSVLLNESKEVIIEITQEKAVTGEPVVWSKKAYNVDQNFTLEIPEGAIEINSTNNLESSEPEEGEPEPDIEIIYETPAPEMQEQKIANGKEIVVSSQEHYTNVLTKINIDESLNLQNKEEIIINWIENNTRLYPKDIIDTDGNGIYDTVEFVIPHLSTQTFEIIVINRAQHLDSSRFPISNIFSEVKKLDGVYSEDISSNEYVRVTFEKEINSQNDITIYPKIISGNPSIEIYQKDSNIKIAEFSNLFNLQENKVYLNNLVGSQDAFDLKIVGGVVQFDYIVDPSTTETADMDTVTFVAATSGTEVDSGSYVNTQVNDGSVMRVGYLDGAAQEAVDFEIALGFNLSSLGISGSQIINISADISTCWVGGTGAACGTVDQPEFDQGTSGEFRVYLNGSSRSLLDCISTECEATDELLLGNYNTNPAWGASYNENLFQYELTSGFDSSNVQNDILTLILKTNGTNYNVNYEVEHVVDYVSLNIWYNDHPTEPTQILCNGGACNFAVDEQVNLSCSGSTDPEGDAITYFINDSFGYIGNHTTGSNLIWNTTLETERQETNFTCVAYDLAGSGVPSSSYSTSKQLIIDHTNPVVNFTLGMVTSGSTIAQNFIYINTTVNETNFENITFEIYTDSGLLSQDSYTDSTRSINYTALSSRIYYYNVTVFDKASNVGYSLTENITLDSTAPSGSTSSPNSGLYSNSQSQNLTGTASDFIGLKEAILFIFNSTGALINQTNISLSGTTAVFGIIYTFASDGIYEWFYKILDLADNFHNTTNSTITIDTTSSTISLKSVSNNSADFDGNLIFQYNVTDPLSPIENCSLVLNEISGGTDISIINGTTESFSKNGLTHGNYNYSIECFDTANNAANSQTRFFDVISIENFDGQTTNLEAEDLAAVSNFVLENQPYGKITYNGTIDITDVIYFDSLVSISENNIFVNSTKEPKLNSSSKIEFYNLPYEFTPVILKDGNICPDCEINSYSSGNLSFNATSFSTYSTTNNTKLIISDESEMYSKYSGDDVRFFANYTNLTSSAPVSGGICNITFTSGQYQMSYNGTSLLFEYNRSFSLYGSKKYDIECFGTGSLEDANATEYALIQYGSPSGYTYGYKTQAGTYNLIGADEFIPLDYPVQDLSRAFVIAPNMMNQENTTAGSNGDPATNSDDSFASIYLYNTTHIRAQRTTTADGPIVITWQVLESVDEEFEVQRGEKYYNGNSVTINDTLASTVNTANSMSWFYLNTTYNSNRGDAIQFYSNLTNSTNIQFTREDSAITAGITFRWVVVEWNISKINSFSKGYTGAITGPDTTPNCFSIGTAVNKTSSILIHQNHAIDDNDGGLDSSARAGYIQDGSTVCFYDYDGIYSAGVKWYVIDFGNTTNREENIHTDWATTDYRDDIFFTNTYNTNKTLFWLSGTCNGDGTAKPRHTQWWEFNSSAFYVQRTYGGQNREYAWQVLELPFYENLDSPLFFNPTVNETITSGKIRFNITVNDTTDGVTWVKGIINEVEQNFINSTGDIWYYDYTCTGDESVSFTYASAEDNGTIPAGNSTSVTGINATCDSTNPTVTFVSPDTPVDGYQSVMTYFDIDVLITETNFQKIIYELYNETDLINQTNFSTQVDSIRFSDIANGLYYYNVTVIDLVNNTGSTETRNITFDNVAPKIDYAANMKPHGSFTSQTTIFQNVTIIEDNFKNVTFYLYDDLMSLKRTPVTYTGPERSLTWTTLSDGLYFYQVESYDQLGNYNQTTLENITLDTLSPVVNFGTDTKINNFAYDRDYITVDAEYTEDNFKNITFDLYNSTRLVDSTTYTDSTVEITWNSLPNGDYWYNVTIYDKASNSGATTTRKITLDSVNPVVAYGTNTESNLAVLNQSNIFINVTVTEDNFKNITFTIYDSSMQEVSSQTFADSTRNYDFTGLNSAEYNFRVSVFDTAGNIGQTSIRTVYLDTLPPLVTIINPQSTAYGYNESLPLNYTVVDQFSSLDTCWWNIDGGANQTVSCTGSTTFDTDDGEHTIYFYANDTFGYVGSDSVIFLIATGGPAIVLIDPQNDTYYSTATQVDFNYTASDLQFVDTCSLWGNWNGGWHLNQTDYNWLSGNISFYSETLDAASPWNNWTNGGDGAGCTFTQGTSTPSGSTGPSGGYGPAPSGTSSFLFTEASSGQNCAYDDPGQHWATLETGLINASEYEVTLSFWYHLYGAAISDAGAGLYVDVNDSSGWNNDTFSITSQQQTAETQNWINQEVDISDYSGMINIRLRAVVGNDYTSDISIDQLNLTLDSRKNKPYGNFSVNLSQETDYFWNIECNDTTGLVETGLNNRTFAIDLTNPVVDFDSGTAATGSRTSNDYVYIDSIITEDNFQNITYYLYNSSSISSYSYISNTTNHTFLNLLSGDYDYNFTVYDKAGRFTSSSTRNITLDTNYPSGSLIAPSDDTFTKNQTHNFTASVSDLLELASARLFIFNSTGGLVNTTLINLAGLTAATIGVIYTFLYDDVFTWFYQVIDSVGNEYNTTSYETEIDSTAPVITFIAPTEETDTIFNRDWILLNTSIYEQNYKNITFWLYDSTGLKYENGFSTNIREVNWTLLPDEDYTYNVTSWDLAGNEGSSETRTLTLDTTPAIVTFSGVTKPNGAVENSQSITVEVSVTEPNEANITFNLYNATGYNILSNSYYDSRRITTWTNMISTFGEGLYYYNVTVVDEVGLSGDSPSRTIILDNTDPIVDFISPTQNNYANISQDYIYINTSITEDNYDNITFFLYNSTGLVSSAFYNDSIIYHNFTSLADAVYEYNFTVYDKAGNSASSATRTITLDTTNPLIQFVPSTEDNDTVFNRNWAYMNVSVTETSLYQIIFNIYDTDSLYDQQIFTDSTYEYNFTSLPDNNYWYNVTAIDFSGNTNSTETRKIGLDSEGPLVTIQNPRSKTYGYNESLPLTHTVTDSVSGLDTCWWNIDDGTNQTINCNEDTTFNTSSGSHTINFYANDTFGNLGYDNVTFYISLTGPAIELFMPSDDTFYSAATLINFSFSANDPDGVDVCSLWGDWDSGWHLNETYSGTWRDIGYKSRKNITIINGGATALADFPAYINVTYDYTESLDYNDIRFFNGSCEYDGVYLDFEIEDYDTNSGNFWVRIPSLEVGANTICMYYKNSNADNNESSTSVWSNSYTSVYHLDHTSGTALDTLGNFNAEDGITPDSNMDQSGAIGKADYFDGSDYLGTNPEWDVDGAHTYCAWVKFSTAHDGTILEDGGLTDGTGLGVTSTGELRYAECYNNVHNPLDSGSSYNDNEWHYVCGGHTGTVQFLYVDGQLSSQVTQGDGLSGTDNARIGQANNANPVFDDNVAHGFIGYLDEIRVSSTDRSADWINQSYQQIANYSSMISFGTEINFTAFSVEVSNEGTYNWNVECNDTNSYSSFALSNYSFIIDVTNPQVLFGTGTEDDGATTGNDWVYIDANVIENNFENITFYLYNATYHEINSQTYTDSTRNYNFTGLTSGTYYYNITVFDKAVRSGSSPTRSIILDFTPPQGNLLTPENDSYVRITSQNLTANFTDPAGLAQAILFVLNQTGYIVYSQVISLAGGITQTIGTIYDFVSEGIYTWFYQVEDNVGNKINLTEYKITVDTTNPSINYSSGVESSGQVLEREHIFVNVTANDAYFKNITFYLYDSDGLVFANTFTDGTRKINWTSLPNEVYYYNVTVFDIAGNSNSTLTRNITLDTINPSISYTGQTQPNNAMISGDTVAIYVSVVEANEKNITFYLYNETGSIVRESSYIDGTRSVSWNLLDEGIYYYNVTVYDKVNLSDSTTTRTITLDNTAPQIDFGFGTESNNSAFARNYVYFSVNIIEDNFKNVTLSLYNSTGLVSHQSFTDTTRNYNWTSLPDEVYYYNATTFDEASNSEVTTTRTIILDNVNPLIDFGANTATDNFNKTQDWIFVNITFTEDNLQNITYNLYNDTALVNSTTVTSAITYINFTNLLSAVYYYNVTMYDKASNSNSTSTRKIGIDYLGPSVSIIDPKPKAYGYNESLPLSYIVNDAIVGEDSCWYSVYNGTDYIVSNTSVSCTGPAEFNVSGGIHTFTLHFYSNDTFNNLGYDNVTFLVSTTGPAIELIAPPDESFYAQSTIIEFNYSAEDPDYVRSCSLWGEWNGGWHLNQTDFDWVTGYFSQFNEDIETVAPWNNWTNGGDGQCVFTRGTSTPSGSTGPTGGYGPTPDGASNFLFTEASSGQNCAYDEGGHWATLETGMIDADEYNVSLSFWYHLYGASINAAGAGLYIDVNDSSGWHNDTFSITGQQQTAEGQDWLNQVVNFGDYSGMINIRFRAVVGNDYTSDISIDEFDLTLEPRADKLYGNFTLNLSEEGTHEWNIECNDTLGYYTFAVNNYSITFDVTNPIVDFGANTQPDNANVSQDYIFVNSTIIENNFKNITFYLYNETGSLVARVSKNETIRYHNFTGLNDGIYYYNMTVFDKASRSNSSSTRTIRLDKTPPTGSLTSPADGSYKSNPTINFTGSFSDPIGLKQVILFIFNSTGSLIHTNTTILNGALSAVVGSVYTFLYDDVFTWFYQAEDSVGNLYNTTSRILFVDTTQPFVAFTSPTEDNNSYISQNYIYFNTTVIEDNFDRITFRLFDGEGYESPSPNTFFTSKRDINYTNLIDDEYTYFVSVYDLASNSNSTETRTITLDNVAPILNYIAPTKVNYYNSSKNYIFVNTSLTELNIKNITFNLYNETTLINSTTYNSSILYINWTSLTDGVYYYNVTTYDKANHYDSLSTRQIAVDTTLPLVDFGISTAPDDSTFERDWIYIDSNVVEDNFKNMSYRLYDNNSILINSTTYTTIVNNINFSASGENKTYLYNIIVYDWAGNYRTTSTRNITLIDTTAPRLVIISPENTTYPYVSGIRLNYIASDLHLDTCWYSLDFGANTSLPNCQTISLPDFTDETGHRIDLFVNDTMGYLNQSSVVFFVNSSLIETPTYKVLRGTTFVDGNATEEIEITDMSKSFILHTSRASDNGPDTLQLISKFDVSNEVTFENYDAGLGAVVDWNLISGPAIRVQRGTIPYTTQANLSLSISSVNLSNSFIVVNSKLDSSDSADNVEGFFSGKFEDDSNIIFQRDNGTESGVLSYQVVSWNETNVQSGEIIIHEGNTTSGDILINSVNTNNSFIIFSHNLFGDDSVQDLFVKANFTNSTNIRFDRRGSGGNMTISYFVVTADFFDSQSSDYEHQISSSDQFVSLNDNLTNTRRAFDIHSNDNAGTTTTFANAFTTQTIENETYLSIQKGTGSGAGTTSWFAVEIRDTNTPVINGTSPVDNFNYSTHEIGPFFFEIKDESDMTNCSLYADWNGGWHINQTIYSVNSSIVNNFSAVNISTSGFYNWSVECTDIYGNIGKSKNYTLASFLPPQEPPFINITQTTNDGTGDITIFWNSSLDSIKYNVYYSPNATDFQLLTQTIYLNYTDNTFSGNKRRFYKVEAWNPSGVNLSTYTYGAHVYDLRHNALGNYTIKNRNWISFPTNFTYLPNANKTLNEITGATSISRLNTATQDIVSCSEFSCPPAISCTATACNFNITAGEGYEVTINESGASQINWSGVGIVQDPMQISLAYDESGTRFNKNWIAMTASSVLFDASDLGGNILGEDAITTWDNKNQVSTGYLGEVCMWFGCIPLGTDFNLTMERGYEVSMTQDSAWTQV